MTRHPLKRFFLFKFLLFVIIQSCALGQTDSEAVQDEVVCVTRTGKKYHRCSCQHVSKSKIEISLSEAQTLYTPCLVCKPDRSRKLGKVQTIPDESEGSATETEVSSGQNQEETSPPAQETGKSRQCSARTKSGTRCKRMTTSPSGKCFQHDK